MKFRGHESFFIRKGWLNKGIRKTQQDPYAFMGKNGNPMDIFGMGLNMTKSLRYWMQVTGINYEPKERQKRQKLTKLGEFIYKYDPYIEEIGTLLLIHYNLASNFEEATSWYYFFNEFNMIRFDESDFISAIERFIDIKGEKIVSRNSLKDDYDCIIKTYIPLRIRDPKRVHPENNIDSPLGDLNLIECIDIKNKVYIKKSMNIDFVDPNIAMFIIKNSAFKKDEIKIDEVINSKNNLGKILNLELVETYDILRLLEQKSYIDLVRTAGLDVIRFTDQKDPYYYIEKYYKSIKS